ncbi:winged helix-turn-helix domain-containing protein [Rheinheimera muenzenbergensis]|uniref:Winged helix-turn-helix domain-containing protein n=1 Tax=Rheinheimera muenzenbergensis TaxID=1193628 RepID=A0ABU8C2F2_9GAMM
MSNLDPVVQIGDWYYQVVYGELWPVTIAKPEHPHRLEPRLQSLLNFFLRHPNTLLAKDTLIDKVWPAEEGTDAAVMRAVGALRKILGDDVRSPCYIATISKKGYCWLAEIKAVELLAPSAAPDNPLTESVAEGGAKPLADDNAAGLPWRFISTTAAVVLLCCASLAYVLAKYTAEPLVRLPDTITPISALSGQEYWPILNASLSHVVYQHRAPEQPLLNWSVQNLADLKVEHVAQYYQTLSEPVWLDDQNLLFRGGTAQQQCAFYQQQLLPVAKPAQLLQAWPCHQVLSQALLRWQEQWLWADTEPGSSDVLLYRTTGQDSVTAINRIANNWRQLSAMLLSDDNLYLLVQQSVSSSTLYRLALPDGQPELVISFPYLVQQFSWWSKQQLLLSAMGRELEIFDLTSKSVQRLGPLTIDLTQASKAPGQVLATQFLDYTTDIYQIADNGQRALLSFSPWHISNRSESLLAVSEHGTAFVSQRTGLPQVWLARGRDSTQLTRLNEQQQVQQLLWHKANLLLMLNNQLFQLDQHSAELTSYPANINTAGRVSSCNDRLYWTELTAHGWQLFSETDSGKSVVYADVVDVRCGPDNGLVLQFSHRNDLAVLHGGQLSILPAQLNWRQLSPEQWFTDSSGIYWLDTQHDALKYYDWHTQQLTELNWPQSNMPLAIYSGGKGIGFVVRQRPHDTDIVWLQNRR